MKYFLCLTLLCLLCIADAYGLPAQVILISHAEATPKGDTLSTRGRMRAAALVPYFQETPDLLLYGPPAAIYAMGNSAKTPAAALTVETVKPLADALKLVVNTTFDRNSYKQMIEDIKNHETYAGKSILICWDPSLLPEIARNFKALQAPFTWRNDVFDRTWVLVLDPKGKVRFTNMPQRILMNDSR